jgi:hypothetical protein
MNEKQLKRLAQIQESIDKGVVHTEELGRLMTALFKVIGELKTQLDEKISDNKTLNDEEIRNLSYDLNRLEFKIKELVNKSENNSLFKISELSKRFSDKLENMERDIPAIPDLTYLEDEIRAVEAKIPVIPEPVSKDTPDEIVAKINTKPNSIKPEIIIGWNELERKVLANATAPKGDFDVRIGVSKTELKNRYYTKDEVDEIVSSVTGGGGTWYNEAVTGTVNGSNDTFTLSNVPVSPNSLILSIGRQIQIQGVDYSLSGSTITYTTAPDNSLSTEPHRAIYQ